MILLSGRSTLHLRGVRDSFMCGFTCGVRDWIEYGVCYPFIWEEFVTDSYTQFVPQLSVDSHVEFVTESCKEFVTHSCERSSWLIHILSLWLIHLLIHMWSSWLNHVWSLLLIHLRGVRGFIFEYVTHLCVDSHVEFVTESCMLIRLIGVCGSFLCGFTWKVRNWIVYGICLFVCEEFVAHLYVDSHGKFVIASYMKVVTHSFERSSWLIHV